MDLYSLKNREHCSCAKDLGSGLVFANCDPAEQSFAQSPLQSPVNRVETLYKIEVTLRVSTGGQEKKNQGTF